MSGAEAHHHQEFLWLEPGRAVGMLGPPGTGLTRLGLLMLAGPARSDSVAFLDVRGWLCPPAAWECGIPPDRLVVVRCADRRAWAQVAAVLCQGLRAIYAEVPTGVGEASLRRLVALARARGASLVLRPLAGEIPPGLVHLQVRGEEVLWEGAGAGHGRLRRRRLVVRLSGRGVGGVDRIVEVEDDGALAVRVVAGLGASPFRSATG